MILLTPGLLPGSLLPGEVPEDTGRARENLNKYWNKYVNFVPALDVNFTKS
jgi:hypothetical protein